MGRLDDTIAAKELQLTAARAAYLKALESGDVESYQFDSREGKQATTLRSPSVLGKIVRDLEAELERLYKRRDGGGLCYLRLNRG